MYLRLAYSFLCSPRLSLNLLSSCLHSNTVGQVCAIMPNLSSLFSVIFLPPLLPGKNAATGSINVYHSNELGSRQTSTDSIYRQ